MIALLALAARAQEPVPAPTPEELHQLEAAALYEVGLVLTGRRDFEQACTAMQRLVEAYDDTPYAERATAQIALIAEADPTGPCGTTEASARERSGATELAVSQSVVGPLFFAIVVPGMVGEAGPRTRAALAIGGLGVGFGGSLLLTSRHPIGQGQAMSLYTGEVLGAWNGIGLATALALDEQAAFGAVAGGTVFGGAIGGLVAWSLDPTAGEMALVRSGATWGTWLGAVSILVAPAREHEAIPRMMVASDLGAISGAVVALYAPETTRGRVNLINLAGYAGALVGGGAAQVILRADTDSSDLGLFLFGGTAAGLGIGIWATRNVDEWGFGVGSERDRRIEWLAQPPLVLPDGDGLRLQVGTSARF